MNITFTVVRRFHCSSVIHKKRSNFIDSLQLWVQGGAGGQGFKKFTGVGGKGGDVYVVGSAKAQLQQLKKTGTSFKAGQGCDATKRRVLGAPGDDVVIPVPLGVGVVDKEGNRIGDVNQEKEKLLIAKGAPGGGPRNDFIGRRAEGHHVMIDLTILADVGLVGFPNAGKSSLLACLSRASPKIASYPFTTLEPQIGVIEYEDLKQISVADLPGLVEGAHVNVGLGHSFLKHIERTKLLLFVVDVMGFRLSQKVPTFRTPLETVMLLMKELEMYNKDLLQRPAILCLNKVDHEEGDMKVKEAVREMNNLEEHVAKLDPSLLPEKRLAFKEVHAISAKEDRNIDAVAASIRAVFDEEVDKTIDHQALEEAIQKTTFHFHEKRGIYVV